MAVSDSLPSAHSNATFAFKNRTVLRLLNLFQGFVPMSAAILVVGGMVGEPARMAGATLVLVGVMLGVLVGHRLTQVVVFAWEHPAVRRAPLILGLFSLPLAILPIQPELLLGNSSGFPGVGAALIAVALACPFGCGLGLAWVALDAEERLARANAVGFISLGLLLGLLVSSAAVGSFSLLRGAFLISLLSGPLMWPTLPLGDARCLLVRMAFVLQILIATVALLFVEA